MPRPRKYATAKEAAEHDLYSRKGKDLDLSLKEFIDLVTGRCSLCGGPPSELLRKARVGDVYDLRYNKLKDQEHPVCNTCLLLLDNHDLKEVLTVCARIMARRMHGKINKMFFSGREKPLSKRSGRG